MGQIPSEDIARKSISEPQIINGGAFGKVAEVKIIEKKSLWYRFKRLFSKQED